MQSHFSFHFLYPPSLLHSLCSPSFHTSGLCCVSPDVVPICEGRHNCWHDSSWLCPGLDRGVQGVCAFKAVPPWQFSCVSALISLSVLSALSIPMAGFNRNTKSFLFVPVCLFRQLVEIFNKCKRIHIKVSLFCNDSYTEQLQHWNKLKTDLHTKTTQHTSRRTTYWHVCFLMKGETLSLMKLTGVWDLISVVKGWVIWGVVGKPQLWIGSMWPTSGSAYGVKEGAFVTARHVATK